MKAELNILKLSDKELEIVTGGIKITTLTGDDSDISIIVGQDMKEGSIIVGNGNDYLSITGENHFPNIS